MILLCNTVPSKDILRECSIQQLNKLFSCNYISSVLDGGRPKIHHINTPLQHMVLPMPWQAFLHRLPMTIVQKSVMALPPFLPFNNTAHKSA